jgi:hypothetical protein
MFLQEFPWPLVYQGSSPQGAPTWASRLAGPSSASGLQIQRSWGPPWSVTGAFPSWSAGASRHHCHRSRPPRGRLGAYRCYARGARGQGLVPKHLIWTRARRNLRVVGQEGEGPPFLLKPLTWAKTSPLLPALDVDPRRGIFRRKEKWFGYFNLGLLPFYL